MSHVDQWIQESKKYLKSQLGRDVSGHDPSHSLRVYHTALKIAQKEPEANQTVIALAALLHDTIDDKLFDETTATKQLISFFKQLGIPKNIQEKVLHIIQSISFRKSFPNSQLSLEAKIVQDADRLDAIGAIGIARAFAYGAVINQPMYSDDSFPTPNEDNISQLSQSTTNHFYKKLLKLKKQMNTETGRKMAESRHELLEIYLEHFEQEI